MKAYIIISSVDVGYTYIEGMFLNKTTAIKSLKILVAETDKDLEVRHLISHKGGFKRVSKQKGSNSIICYKNNFDRVELVSFELNKNFNKVVHSCKPDDFDSIFTNKIKD